MSDKFGNAMCVTRLTQVGDSRTVDEIELFIATGGNELINSGKWAGKPFQVAAEEYFISQLKQYGVTDEEDIDIACEEGYCDCPGGVQLFMTMPTIHGD